MNCFRTTLDGLAEQRTVKCVCRKCVCRVQSSVSAEYSQGDHKTSLIIVNKLLPWLLAIQLVSGYNLITFSVTL